MLTSAQVRNFRTFGELTVERLSRINLVAGRNNSGKTSLLEALFLLSGFGDPRLTVDLSAIRGIDSVSGPREMLWELLWKLMFFALDSEGSIEIKGDHSSHESLTLHISLEWRDDDNINLPLFDDSGEIPARSTPGKPTPSEPTLLFSFQRGSASPHDRRMHIGDGRMTIRGGRGIGEQAWRRGRPSAKDASPAIFLTTRISAEDTRQDAMRLGRLRKRKQGDLVLKALQSIEPRLQSIEDNSASGSPMIWGDVGLTELVPLSVMGEGMIRIAQLVLAIADLPKGLVLVDEIENGLHHSVLPRFWKAIDVAAQQFNTQVVATTHSLECVQAAGQSFRGSDSFLLHRLESSGSGNRCVTYQPEDIEAAMLHDLEVR